MVSLVKKSVRTVKATVINAKVMLLAFVSALMGQLSYATTWNPGGTAYGKHSAGSDANEILSRGETLGQNIYKFFVVAAMVGGLGLVGIGLWMFYSSEEDQQKKKKTAWICIIVGGALSVIGFIMFSAANTITGKA
ncbi:hypothetical protein [Acinetobacter sp. YH01009]|uniref:hypothetical protein n=1 Tax=Acinetobacter sp. YH01009 TaxID=2601025 RepID=UPI0015D2BAA6|nr:hypothetical protein [Acinetobacter sp. YH01009]